MDNKLQLLHPAGKKAVKMDMDKYASIKASLLSVLQSLSATTHKQLFEAISEDFKRNNIAFEGSLEWHMEWVKLDLEARKEITRNSHTSPLTWSIS